MATATFSKKFYTAVVWVDYMVGTIVADRRYEIALRDLKRLPKEEGCCSKKKPAAEIDDGIEMSDGTTHSFEKEGDQPKKKKGGLCGKNAEEEDGDEAVPQLSEREQMIELVQNKEIRLDDLCRLMYVGEDEEWVRNR